MSSIQNLARFDVRTIERYLKDGTVTEEQYKEYLAAVEREENCGEEGAPDRLWDYSSIRMQAHRRRRIETPIEDEET